MEKQNIEQSQEFLDVNDISRKLFNKDFCDIKYVLVTNYIHQRLLEEEITRTGLYQWLNVFNGEVKYPRDIVDYNEYDIIQVNMSTQDVPLINTIKSSLNPNNKRTKLVVNNDYTTEMWGNAFSSPDTLAREISGADMLFGTEYFQVTALSELTGRKVFIIPHPADIKRLKSVGRPEQKNIITAIWRRYDNFSYIPSLVLRNHGLTTRLIGYDKDSDSRTWLTTSLFDYVMASTNFFEFSKQLGESKVVYDPFTFHSYNRAGIDCAAMGVPVVGSNRTQSINVCYPYTAVDPYDVTRARELITKLLTDKSFHDKVVTTAQTNCEVYNHENSSLVYMNSLYDAILLKDEPKISVKRPVPVSGSGEDVLDILAKRRTRDLNGKTKNNKGTN